MYMYWMRFNHTYSAVYDTRCVGFEGCFSSWTNLEYYNFWVPAVGTGIPANCHATLELGGTGYAVADITTELLLTLGGEVVRSDPDWTKLQIHRPVGDGNYHLEFDFEGDNLRSVYGYAISRSTAAACVIEVDGKRIGLPINDKELRDKLGEPTRSERQLLFP